MEGDKYWPTTRKKSKIRDTNKWLKMKDLKEREERGGSRQLELEKRKGIKENFRMS